MTNRDEPTVSRRDLVLGGAAAAAGIAMARRAIAQDAPSTPPVRVRKDLATLDPDGPDLTTYRRAVRAMKALPPTNRLSWVAQARVHLGNGPVGCPHGNWFFLPWHRAYVRRFEDICRKLGDDPGFALPYWNWTTTRSIPAAFWGDPATNPLAHAARGIGEFDEASDEDVGQLVMDRILAIRDFETFASGASTEQRGRGGSGELESTPHNGMHVFVGGDMGTFMSPLDPIFWCHHANVDRLWSTWARAHANPGDPRWLDFSFPDFVDAEGNPVAEVVRDQLDTFRLGFRYDTDEEVPPPEAVAAMPVESPMGAGQPGGSLFGSVPLTMAVPVMENLNEGLERLDSPRKRDATVRVRVEGVKLAQQPNFRLRVFLQCDYLTAATPITDPHYVATISFFEDPEGHGDAEHPEGPLRPVVVDASRTFARLLKSGEITPPRDHVQVQLVAVPSRAGEKVKASLTNLRAAITLLK